MRRFFTILSIILLIVGGLFIGKAVMRYAHEKKLLEQIVARLEADSRAAQVLVSKVEYDQRTGRNFTTIKFVEFASNGSALPAQYFTFPGNIIQFQSLVIRFDDRLVAAGDRLKGKSAYLFWKVFMLDGKNTQEFEINKVNSIPSGYRVVEGADPYEARLWRDFWSYALTDKHPGGKGIKNAQIEAPGTMFVPGTLYTIKIEHDGGLRIDAQALPDIVRGETISK